MHFPIFEVVDVSEAKPAVCVNLAGVYRWWVADPGVFDRVNVEGVRTLVDVLAAAGVALIQATARANA